MAKKTRISGIVDNSTMGIDISSNNDFGTEMEITKSTSDKLRRALKKAAKDGLPEFAANIIHPHTDSSIFFISYPKKYAKEGKDEDNIQYEFKKQGSRHFLNVRGNPTALISGSNDIPVLIMDFDYQGMNRAAITFKYMNRILYALLDTLLAGYGFKWEGLDKKRLVDGDIAIHRYQIAWYSNDLGEYRDDVCRFLRKVFGGLDAVEDKVINVGDTLGISAKLYPENVNITLETKAGDKKYFGLTFYAKDQEPGYNGDKERLEKLIRWDCTLHYAFLSSNRLKTVKALEEKYVSTCEVVGYDLGFIRYLADKVERRLKLPYLLGLSLDRFRQGIAALENVDGKNHSRVAKHWLEHGKNFDDDAEAAKFFDIQPSNYSVVKGDLLKLGIDVTFPRRTHDTILETRLLSMRSLEERSAAIIQKRGSNNIIPWEELERRDTKLMKKLNAALDSSGKGALKVRKFTPMKIKTDNFWIYKRRVDDGKC